MEFAINFTGSAKKDFKDLPKDLKDKVVNILEAQIAENPYVAGKKLKGKWKGMYAYPFSNYRIVYQIFPKDQSVAIMRIKPRGRVYR